MPISEKDTMKVSAKFRAAVDQLVGFISAGSHVCCIAMSISIGQVVSNGEQYPLIWTLILIVIRVGG